jgi:hypothetical protein
MSAATRGDIRNLADGCLNCREHIARAGRTALVEKSENVVEVCKRSRAVAEPHASPWRFQNATTSASEAKAPRLASAIAARSSALKA